MSLRVDHRVSLLLVASTLLLSACGDDAPTRAPAVEPPANVNGFFATLPNWEQFSPPVEASNIALGPATDSSVAVIDSSTYACTSTPYSLANTPDKVVTFNPDVEILWVGSLLQGNGYQAGIGSLAELPIRQRQPVEVTINLLADDTRRTVEDPNVASVGEAIGQLISTAQAAGHRAGSNIEYRSETTHSMTQAMIQMGVSAKYSGANIKAELEADLSNTKRTITAYFAQQMFTVSMVLPQSPADVFSDAFTEERLADARSRGLMSADNPPVYVSSITYGRILMFTFTSTSSESKIQATLNAMYAATNTGGSLDAELQTVLDNAEIRVVTVGGDAENALALIRSNNLADYFSADAPLTTARPISYTIRNLKDNVTARVAETTEYNLRQCVPTEIPATGAVYRVWLDRIQAVELTNSLGFQRTALLHWRLSLRTNAATELLADRGTGPLGGLHSTVFGPGTVRYFKDYGSVDTSTVHMRYDGSTHMVLPIGTFTDLYFDIPRTYTFETGGSGYQTPITYRFGSRNMPNHDQVVEGYITRTFEDSALRGTARFRIFFKFRRERLLFD